MIRAQPSLVDFGNEQYHDGFASWYKNDVALMESCKAGTFRNHDTVTIESANLLLTLNSMLPTTDRVSQTFPNAARVTVNSQSISNFLTMPYFDNLAKETEGWSQEGSMSRTLIDTVMAFGYGAYLASSQHSVSSEESKKAECYSRIALRSRSNILSSPNTLSKLQVGQKSWHFQLFCTNSLDTLSNGQFNWCNVLRPK